MDINTVFTAALSLGGLGLLFGGGLALASQKFAVPIDPRVEAVREAVPGANCGACGFPGCDGFAQAVVDGKAPIDGCPVGGEGCVKAISQIMGVEATAGVKRVAKLKCEGHDDHCSVKYHYEGYASCTAAAMLNGGPKQCQFGCLGLGTCVEVCPFDAIKINEKGLAEVLPEKCTACLKCIKACPKSVLEMVPYQQIVEVICNNKERGGHVKKNCSVACIACGLCQRNCPEDAIKVIDHLAVIDYDLCTNCKICVDKCPTKAIQIKQ